MKALATKDGERVSAMDGRPCIMKVLHLPQSYFWRFRQTVNITPSDLGLADNVRTDRIMAPRYNVRQLLGLQRRYLEC